MKIADIIIFGLFIATMALSLLRMSDVIDVPWWLVLLPAYVIPAILVICAGALGAIIAFVLVAGAVGELGCYVWHKAVDLVRR